MSTNVPDPIILVPRFRRSALMAAALWSAACSSSQTPGADSDGAASGSGGADPVSGSSGSVGGSTSATSTGATTVGAGGVDSTGIGGVGSTGMGGARTGGSGGASGTGGGDANGAVGSGGSGGTAGGGTGGSVGSLGPPGPFACTQFIGYSQTEQWYGAFQAEVTDAKWELRWAGGHGVDVWKDPGAAGWSAALVSPCAESSNDVERVQFSISGPHGSDVSAWEADIEEALNTFRSKLPQAHVFVLEPVVGGPNMNCSRADEQNPFVLEAIKNVAARDAEVYVGYDAHVDSCSQFQDTLGHLTSSAASQIGTEIGQFYAANLPDP